MFCWFRSEEKIYLVNYVDLVYYISLTKAPEKFAFGIMIFFLSDNSVREAVG
jgi:hypothetical protein